MPGKSLLLFGLFLFSLATFKAQGFIYSSVSQGIQVYNPNAFFGAGVSFYDFNKDGLDDLTFCIMGDSVVFYQNSGTTFIRSEVIPNNSDAKQPVWVDIDNDHDADIIVSKRNGGLSLYENSGDGTFQNITSQLNKPNAPGAHSYGCSWADYDKDGLLDCYVCNYNWNDGINNWLFHNLGDGNFEEIATDSGVSNGSRPSFQSVWIDYNFDNWPDLFVVNDKLTGNTLYRNLGNGTFQDVSLSTGAYQTMCAMSAGVSDYELDGDWDIYVSNFIFDNSFLKFQDGVFENIAAEVGLEVNAMCWGSLWIDYDNDSDEDLHIATTSPTINNNQNYFYTNNGDGSFSLNLDAGFVNDDFNSYSSAKGDWNRDGFADMVVTNSLNNTASLYTNTGIGGNSVTIGLEGTISNADAVGSLITVFANDLSLVHYTMCGENYLSQDSQYEIFGIGESSVADSVQILWPSGFSETHYELNANGFYLFTEGQTLQASITSENNFVLCGIDTISLYAGEWSSYIWSTGDSTPYIEVSEPGEYSVVVFNAFGLSDTVSVSVVNAGEPQYSMTILHPSCHGSDDGDVFIELFGTSVDIVMWSDGNTELHRDSLLAGEYLFEIITTDGCVINDTAFISQPQMLEASVMINNVSCSGGSDGSVFVEVEGGTGEIDIQWGDINPQACPAGTYNFIISDENSCVLNVIAQVTEPPHISVDSTLVVPACPGYTGSAYIEASGGTGILTFDWMGADSDELFPGEYEVMISDEAGCQVSHSLSVTEFSPMTAEYELVQPYDGANGSIGIIISGGVAPYQIAWSNGQETPFIDELGPGTYVCFVTDEAGCTQMFEVTLIDVSMIEWTAGLETTTIVFSETLKLPSGIGLIRIHDMTGRLVYQQGSAGESVISTSDWPVGFYLMSGGKKILKIRD